MKTLEDMIREDLGLPPDAGLEIQADAALPASEIGYGEAAAAAIPSLDDLRAHPQLQPLDLTTPTDEAPPFAVGYDMGDARVVHVHYSAGSARACRGSVHVEEGRVVLDGRKGTASAHLTLGSGEHAVCVHDGRFRSLRVVATDEASWDALERWQPDLGEEDLRDPPIGELLAGWEAQDWLQDTALALASSESVVARAASLGVIGRLWEPSTPAEADALREHPDRDPNARLIALIESLPLPVVERLESIACTHAAALIEPLSTVERQAAAKGAAPAAEVRDLAYARDDLESVFFVIVQRRRGDKLGEVLARVDDAVTSAWSSLPPAGSMRGDLRLETVALLEPDAWWGALAGD